MPTHAMNRRTFLRTGAAALAVSRLAPRRAWAAPSGKKYVIGQMGCGGRGNFLLEDQLTKRPNVEIAYLCDIDSNRLKATMKKVTDLTGKSPKPVDDFRRILDDKDVHVLFNPTPDHWHAIPTILACQAGKDVYVEKPASHNIWEGRKMVEAARKYKRVVQLGTQTRSGPYTIQGVEFLRSGKLGEIHFARVLNMKRREPIGHKDDEPVPAGVKYDNWLGPAPSRPFNPNRFHYAWHWYWDYSGGDIINDGVHQIDAARYLIGKAYPNAVSCAGGQLAFHDDQETPDTQVVSWEFDDLLMTFEQTLWTPHMQKEAWEHRDLDDFPDWRIDATQIEIHGTKGMMKFGRHGGGWQAWNPDGKIIAESAGHHPHGPHIDNFFACIESRNKPNADIEEGHLSTNLAHLGNISYRLGGIKLKYDGKTETFPGNKDANALLTRPHYREPYVIPDPV